MKKFIKLCAVAALLAFASSCSEQETMESTLTQEMTDLANEYISPTKAIEIANEFAAKMDGLEPGSRSGATRRASSVKNVKGLGFVKSRTADDQIYVVNYDNGQGFALVSKKAIETPVLAFIPEGSYNEKTAEKNLGFQEFANRANDLVDSGWYASGASTNGTITRPIFPPVDSLPQEINPLNYYYVNHLIYTDWGQEDIYGEYCPNKIAGCGPVAFAMICAYYNLPQKIRITYDNSFKYITPNWSKIKSHKYEKDPIGPSISYTNPDESLWPECKNSYCTQDSHVQIGKIMRQIGEDVHAKYESDGTSVALFQFYASVVQKYPLMMGSFGDFDMEYLKKEILQKHPAMIAGSSSNGNHIWVCDGYVGENILKQPGDYFHYNWGWDGDFNGFFLADVFKPYPNHSEYTAIKCSVVKPK